MNPVSNRMKSLSPRRRELLERLMEKKKSLQRPVQQSGASLGATDSPVAVPDAKERPHGLIFDEGVTKDDKKRNYKQFYDDVTQQLDSSEFGHVAYFLNWGYAADDSSSYTAVELPRFFLNKNSVRLVLELVGDCDVRGSHVLDVGCGRGGTVFVLTKFFEPASVSGLDLSSEAVNYCTRTHDYPNVRFLHGDAEDLPFDDATFDFVTNIESSHSYPNIDTFYAEVHRVLKPGGCFLYTDMLSIEESDHAVAAIKALGFVIERDRDISTNVLRSCDEIAETRAAAFDDSNNRELMSEFLCVPGSTQYEEMKRGVLQYRMWKIRKEQSAERTP